MINKRVRCSAQQADIFGDGPIGVKPQPKKIWRRRDKRPYATFLKVVRTVPSAQWADGPGRGMSVRNPTSLDFHGE